ncbi:MAG: translocation/assembly module TamB domain-containing protein [Alphaproteobacteria bacterium]|uniref:Translocation/assembly module TamB domain-containing protein n=1 Tax=Candidatus Nitrobium versatile TaxID=2884831 RepID=A0A953JCL9_9BACT|nr:translocation/assembly module TamB domain-containing protein [Candidatus Nitrobium versatile]
MKKRVVYTVIAVFVLGILLYASRGPNISNSLKKMILPELELATGKRFIAQKIYINLFPLFIEMKGVKAFGEDGDKFLEVQRVKGYIGLAGLLRKEITIRRLLIKETEIAAERARLEEIIRNVQKRLAEESKVPFKVAVKSVEVDNAGLLLREGDSVLDVRGLNAEIVASESPRFRVSLKRFEVNRRGLTGLNGRLESLFFIRNGKLELKKLKLHSHRSEITVEGEGDPGKQSGLFRTEAALFVESAKRIFGLKNSGEGEVSAKGIIKLDGLKEGIGKVFISLHLKGDLYLETLMELLKVKEPLRGFLRVQGTLRGYLNDLDGSGDAELEKGALFGVEVDRLRCKVLYKDGAMRFTEGNARLYNGSASAEAMIRLPVVNHYTVDIKVKDVDSKGIFKLIKWDPKIPEGKVRGELYTSGNAFNPSGRFSYRSSGKTGDILDRVKTVEGDFSMERHRIHFGRLEIASAVSRIAAEGKVDLEQSILSFTGKGRTEEVQDLSSPYFTSLSGPGDIACAVTGTLDDPELELRFLSRKASLSTAGLGIPQVLKDRTFPFDSVESLLVYRKSLLSVRSLSARSGKEEIGAAGNVFFRKARQLFDMKSADLDLVVYGKGLDIKKLSGTFQDGPPFSGELHTSFRLYGPPGDIRAAGDFQARNAAYKSGTPVDSVEGKISYGKGLFSFSSVRARRGESSLTARGEISLDKGFTLHAEGRRIIITDLLPAPLREKISAQKQGAPAASFLGTLSFVNLEVRGEGSFDRPTLSAKGDVYGGIYRGHSLGRGTVEAVLQGKELTASASFLDKKLEMKGNAVLEGKVPWSVRIDLQPARYDFLLAHFLKEVPDDLLFNMKGTVVAQGDRDHVNALMTIHKAHLHVYGTGFTNNSDVIARIEDRKVTIERLSMRSDAAEFSLGGTATLGQGYDLFLEGASSLAPLKAFSRNIDVIKGNASFIFSITGDWDTPKINGDMDITNGALGLKGILYRLSSISAYIYVDEDRIVLERASGKLSGGDVFASGTAYLQRFSIKRFFLQAQLKGITASLRKDFWVSFDGDLHYRGTPESPTLLGDVTLKKARYSERTEWKSWLLRLRQREKTRVEPSRLDMTSLNVRVTGSNLVLDNNVARTTMKMDLLVRGTLGQPALLGKVEAKEGIVFFRNNEFKILRATVDFSNPNQIHPYFDIVAETRARSYNIRLALDGYVEQFNLSLSSDPPLNETDIFSLLTVGQIGKNLKGLEGGIGAGEATSFLTGKLQDVLEERLKTVTGFDRVQIDPYISKSTGTVSPRVTLAKRLLGDKLYVTYSTAVGSGEEQVWKLEYSVAKNTSLVGVRDEKGGLGGDIKFRFEFK